MGWHVARWLGAALLGVATTAPARAEYVVASGGTLQLSSHVSLDQVCHSLGRTQVDLLQPPQGGQVEVRYARDFPNFGALNTRSRCNTQRVPSTRVLYHSSPYFRGLDTVSYETIGPDGGLRRFRAFIQVR